MNYFETLENLRRSVFSEEPVKPKQNTTGFIPLKQNMPQQDSRDLADKSKEWLMQIRQASQEARANAPVAGGGFAAGLVKGVAVSVDKKTEKTREANLKAFVERRGDTPSLYAPDKPNLARNIVPLTFNNDWEAVAQAVKDVESGGGDYSIRGPLVTKGAYKGERAMGAYQVMPGNLPQWSMAALGREVTEGEFMQSSEIQDAVFIDQMKKAKDKYGTIEDAVSVWFSGRPVNKAGNASDGYLTTPEYISKFQRSYKTYSESVR